MNLFKFLLITAVISVLFSPLGVFAEKGIVVSPAVIDQKAKAGLNRISEK